MLQVGIVAFSILLILLLVQLGKEIFEIWKLLREYKRLMREDDNGEAWQCPDCKGNILISHDVDDIAHYKFCPYCGRRRYEPDERP